MKLLTLNCHSWQEENQIEKIKYLAKVIKNKKYDVIALQEVNQSIDSNIVYDNIREDNYALILIGEINKLGGDNYNLVWDFSHIGYGKYEEGLAILTRHEILKSESFYITKNTCIDFWKSRKIVKAVIRLNNKNIDFYSCHLGWWNDEDEDFKNQVNELYNRIKEGNDSSILMGDFNNNALIRDEGYDFIKSKGLVDTYDLAKFKDSGVTVKGKIDGWDDNTDEVRVDIIFTNKSMNVLESKVIFNDINKKIISDHYGLEVLIDNP